MNGLFNGGIDKLLLKFMWKLKGPRLVKQTPKNNAVRHTKNRLIYYKVTAVRRCGTYQKNTLTGQQNKIKTKGKSLKYLTKKKFNWPMNM